ncbi:MAG: hypothetical protein VKJ05_01185 [Synechococcaceae cyanobacterium]|nr:hypothetical protein [Synechococcaceae cyanobacterium]
MDSEPRPIRADQLALLHRDDEACPGPWRVRRKLPHLLPAAHDRVDAVVVAALVGQGDLLDDLASLSAEALRPLPWGEPGPDPAVLRGVAARVAAGLAVALMESDLAERIAAALVERSAFAEGWRACPE